MFEGSIDYFVVDHVLQKELWLKEVAAALIGFETFFVGIKTPLNVLEMREQARPDRKPGTAREQIDKMARYRYDLEVDTSVLSPSECADAIIKDLRTGTALQKHVE